MKACWLQVTDFNWSAILALQNMERWLGHDTPDASFKVQTTKRATSWLCRKMQKSKSWLAEACNQTAPKPRFRTGRHPVVCRTYHGRIAAAFWTWVRIIISSYWVILIILILRNITIIVIKPARRDSGIGSWKFLVTIQCMSTWWTAL